MKDGTDDRFGRATLAAYLQAELTAADMAAVEAAVAEDASLARLLEEERALHEALRFRPALSEEVQFLARVHEATDRPFVAIPGARRYGIAAVAFAVACAAGVFLVPRTPVFDDASEFTARSAGSGDEGKWQGLQVFRREGAGPEQDVRRLAPDDELVFAYSNGGPRPRRYLMVFGVDASGAVRWYHPAWVDPAADPEAVPIRAGADVVLPDSIRHDLPPGKLIIHGLFLDEAAHVRALERRLADGTLEAFEGAVDRRVVLEVKE
ncbi:MAG: hypothetical protein RIT81_31345 [Deltaproteobacteria bacterium]